MGVTRFCRVTADSGFLDAAVPGGSAASTDQLLGRAVEAAESGSAALAREVEALDAEATGPRAPAASVQRLIRRSLPDICGLLAGRLAPLGAEAQDQALDHLISCAPFDDDRMRTWVPRLQAHLAAYATSLTRWSEWNSLTHDLAELDLDDVAVRWVTTWERPGDGAVAADFVGYVGDPADLARPGREFAVFARDARAVLTWLDSRHPSRFKGLRLWIVGADDRPVVRWLLPE